MRAHRMEKEIEHRGTLILDGLPFDEGEVVEVIILSRENATRNVKPSVNLRPLRGKPVRYIEPTEPVADRVWESGKYSYSTPTFGSGGFMARPN